MEVFEEQIYGPDMDPEDSFPLLTSLPLFNDIHDSFHLKDDWIESELKGFEPNVKAVQRDILSVATHEINKKEKRHFSNTRLLLKPYIPVFNAKQNSTQSPEILKEGNKGAGGLLNFSSLTESQCQLLSHNLVESEGVDSSFPPGDDNTQEETNKISINEDQKVVDTEKCLANISPEPKQTVISNPIARSRANCPIDNQIKELKPTLNALNAAQNRWENNDNSWKCRKRGRKSLEKELTQEGIKRRRLDQNRELQKISQERTE